METLYIQVRNETAQRQDRIVVINKTWIGFLQSFKNFVWATLIFKFKVNNQKI